MLVPQEHLHGACLILLHGQLLLSIGRSNDFFPDDLLADLLTDDVGCASWWPCHVENTAFEMPLCCAGLPWVISQCALYLLSKLPNSAYFSSWLFVLAELVSTITIQAA
jgi:hypothetical protein